MSILHITKTLMYEFWYYYIKSKYKDWAKLCYIDNDSFIINIKIEDFYEDFADDFEKWFETSNYEEDDKRPLPIGKNKKVIGLFKDQLGGKIIKEFVGLSAKTYSYLMDDNIKHKKAKGTKKCVIKRDLILKNYKFCLFNDKINLITHQPDIDKVYLFAKDPYEANTNF